MSRRTLFRMILGIRHTGIVVSHMERSLGFYRDLLGLTVVSDSTETGPYLENLVGVDQVQLRIVKLRVAQSGTIELLQFLHPPLESIPVRPIYALGISHIALAVADIEAVYTEWRQRGISFNHPPQWSPDKVAKVAYAHDPDGTTIEVVQMA